MVVALGCFGGFGVAFSGGVRFQPKEFTTVAGFAAAPFGTAVRGRERRMHGRIRRSMRNIVRIVWGGEIVEIRGGFETAIMP